MIRVLSLACSRHTHMHGQNFEEKVKLMKCNEIYAPSFQLWILDYFVRNPPPSKGIVTLQNRRLQYNFRSVKAIDRDATSEFVLRAKRQGNGCASETAVFGRNDIGEGERERNYRRRGGQELSERLVNPPPPPRAPYSVITRKRELNLSV